MFFIADKITEGYMSLELKTLQQAVTTLDQAIKVHKEHQKDESELVLALRDSIIQRFEYTYELAWKYIQRWISNNINPESAELVYSRKELYRLAARWGLIKDPLRWFNYHEARNISAHTYAEANAQKVYLAAVAMVPDVLHLIDELKKRND